MFGQDLKITFKLLGLYHTMCERLYLFLTSMIDTSNDWKPKCSKVTP